MFRFFFRNLKFVIETVSCAYYLEILMKLISNVNW